MSQTIVFLLCLVSMMVVYGQSNVTVVDIIESDPQLSILDGLLDRLGLKSYLETRNVTIFAPTDAAFIATGLNLTEVPDALLSEVLTYHVSLESNLTTENIDPGQEITTINVNNEIITAFLSIGSLSGIRLQDTTGGSSFFTNRTRTASNGVVNTINRVLLTSSFIQTTTAPPVTSASPTMAPSVDPLPEENAKRIEALKARVSSLEREISECAACNAEEHRPSKGKGNNGHSKGKGSSSKKSSFFKGFTNPRRKFFY